MKCACFIPIKANSERVKGKNLRELNGKKLYQYICEHVISADVFDDVYIDTNSDEVAEFAEKNGFIHIKREENLLKSTANGNDLLVHHYNLCPNYDLYFQLFATAPYLQPVSIRNCVLAMKDPHSDFDSCFTAIENHGFYWLNGMPVNYQPNILPRSQDMFPIIEETTGLYGITAEALKKYRCRIGANPYIYIVSKFEAVDINTEEDFKMAEHIGRSYWGYND